MNSVKSIITFQTAYIGTRGNRCKLRVPTPSGPWPCSPTPILPLLQLHAKHVLVWGLTWRIRLIQNNGILNQIPSTLNRNIIQQWWLKRLKMKVKQTNRFSIYYTTAQKLTNIDQKYGSLYFYNIKITVALI